MCLGGLVSYFVPNQTDITKQDAYWYALGIVFSSAYGIVTFHPFILFVFNTSAKLRLGCTGLVYRKSLRLSKASIDDGLTGKVINILSNDLAKFDIGLAFLMDVWKGPLEALVFGVFIYYEIGASGIIGMLFLASFIPLQGEHLEFDFISKLNRIIRIYLLIRNSSFSLDWQEISPIADENYQTDRFPC